MIEQNVEIAARDGTIPAFAAHPDGDGEFPAVMVYMDGLAARLYSARGEPREWNDLDRLERWLREQGFSYWWVRNDLEPLGAATDDQQISG